jgi:hypothetical protein
VSCVRVGIGLSASIVAGALLVSAQTPYGVHPRSSPSDYAVSQQTASATFAASIIQRDEVKRLFAVDISNSYIVIEVGIYPSQSGPVQIAADDFLVKAGTSGSEYTHPADAVTVASVIQDKNTPKLPSRNTATVVTTAGVGYESGTDPYTGRRVHGVYTEAGTGVAMGGPDTLPPGPPPKGSSDYDRMTLQQQLAQRALSSGSFTAPVAGFLYFPAKEMKKKNGGYELDYLDDSAAVCMSAPCRSLAAVRLQVRAKSR